MLNSVRESHDAPRQEEGYQLTLLKVVIVHSKPEVTSVATAEIAVIKCYVSLICHFHNVKKLSGFRNCITFRPRHQHIFIYNG